MHSSRMCTARFSSCHISTEGVSGSIHRDSSSQTPFTETSFTETPFHRDTLSQRSLHRDSQTKNPLDRDLWDRDPLGQRPPGNQTGSDTARRPP